MVLRERVADHIYVFRSGMYAQVNAGLITTEEGCVLIDTLPYPQETQQIIQFVKQRLRSHVRYLILTHAHADHVYGAYLFPEAEVISHLLAREHLIKQTRPALMEARQRNTALAEVTLQLPTMLTEKEASIRIGGFTLVLRHAPGHSPDLITVYIKEEKVLYAADAVMPVPYFANGDIDDLRRSLHGVLELTPLEDVIQGHGEVLLRGEVKSVLQAQLTYLHRVEAHAQAVLAAGEGKEALDALTLEACGYPATLMGGLAVQLHRANLYALYGQARRRQQQARAAA